MAPKDVMVAIVPCAGTAVMGTAICMGTVKATEVGMGMPWGVATGRVMPNLLIFRGCP